ncbi:substrate-binding domain-containing protein [Cohnella zeiphila]|uniref:LysR substrate-binding domain-containing protein n=1 Tax=Cohnella zeiphila TaxID=2761120 RepID=A0A7X0VXM0_9BACL|nr:substrate-binding domain-containing protein [Cohnella zeiphila]MBB6733582.1 hypothetical protein [Cohnella zeiphila]
MPATMAPLPGPKPTFASFCRFRITSTSLFYKLNRLAERGEIRADDLRGHRLLVTSASCPYRRKLELELQESGGSAVSMMEIGSMTALPLYVAAGLGVALAPLVALDALPSGTAARPFLGNASSIACGFLYKAEAYPLASAGGKLLAFLRSHLLSNAPLPFGPERLTPA